MKVVISRGWGGFPVGKLHGLSKTIFGRPKDEVAALPRSNPWLISMVEANPGCGLLAVEVPDGLGWTIFDYDGQEAVLLGLPEKIVRITDEGVVDLTVGEFLDPQKLSGI
ncbi:hypothetical protein CU669_16830 [Paramagnetospirillum kuznetsovii]|uniref:Uncharacterized protein n=1 Tax=Paramagnetospirillum kuznetsovii TaxID=2053833 RepID=A0A364NUJ0_9PROT|nr:hypothetical protein [Paramagnetospirillum kuznetsovii]RAU20748.1 hypothetical protein CU669_16830 [Paramagnetospirillum kuznetsovii]